MNKKVKILLITNIIVAITVVGFIIIAKYLMGRGDYGCNFYTLTHLYCPGCGGTRAVFSLLRLDIISAVRYNIAVPFGIFVYLYYNIRGFVEAYRKNDEYFKKQKYILCIVWAFVLVLNFVLKDILLLAWGIDIMPTP